MENYFEDDVTPLVDEHGSIDVALLDGDLDRYDYLRPGRYLKVYVFRERGTDVTCWVPDGFMA